MQVSRPSSPTGAHTFCSTLAHATSSLVVTPLASLECQRSDWPTHRASCSALKGGRWCTIRVRDSLLPHVDPATLLGGEKDKSLYLVTLNRHSQHGLGTSNKDARPYPTGTVAPPNVWGDKPFLIKVQIGMNSQDPGDMMLYDRKRSFQLFFLRPDDPALFRDFSAEMRGPRRGLMRS